MGAAEAPVILAISTLGDAAQTSGVIVAALLAAVTLLAGTARQRALAMLGAAVLTSMLLVGHIWSTEQFEPFRDHPALAAGAVAGALALLAPAAVLFHHRPALLALAGTAVLPFRIPIESGGSTSNLLVPLYLVIAAGALAYAVPRLRGSGGRAGSDRHERGWLEWLLAGSLVLYAVQASYSADFDRALQQLVFFYVPFALLFALLVRVPWSRELAVRCLLVALALAVVFVGIGFFEYERRELLLNPDALDPNQFETYFRVNSLFFDPNIYGRFLAVVMVGLAAVLLWTRAQRTVLLAALALLVLWGGLVLTLSQSSFTALLAGLAVLGALRFGLRRTGVVVGGLAVAGLVVVLAAPGAVGLDQSADAATSGRSDLMEGGVELFADRPAQGYGAGAFRRQYRRQEKASSERAVSASHTIPITIAAEQGVGGLLLYLALVAVAVAGLLRGARDSVPRAAVAAAFIAVAVHTLMYAAFLEDPLSWALLAVGAGLGWTKPPRRPRAPAAAAGAAES